MSLSDEDLTGRIISSAFVVHNALGVGFLEKVYENAMALELQQQGIGFIQQARLGVYYRGQAVGEYFADLLVEKRVICELKAVDGITRQHEVQLVNYLAATGVDIGLLINFGRSVSVRRKFRIYRNPVNPEESC